MFLKRVYKQSRSIFFLIVYFVAGQLFFTYKGVQNFPFFLFGMYSQSSSSICEAPQELKELKAPHLAQAMLLQNWCYFQNKSVKEKPLLKTIDHRFKHQKLNAYAKQKLTNEQVSEQIFMQWYNGYVNQFK